MVESILIWWYECRIDCFCFTGLGETTSCTSSVAVPVGVCELLARVGLAMGASSSLIQSSPWWWNFWCYSHAIKIVGCCIQQVYYFDCLLQNNFQLVSNNRNSLHQADTTEHHPYHLIQWRARVNNWILQASVFWLNPLLLLDGPVVSLLVALMENHHG